MITTFINGMDISFLDEIEQGGGKFHSSSVRNAEAGSV